MPDVEHDVRVDRKAVREAERDEAGEHPRRDALARAEVGDDLAAKLVDAERRRVDHDVGDGAEGREAFALELHPVEHGDRAELTFVGHAGPHRSGARRLIGGERGRGERVRSPRLAESPYQRFIRGVEEHQREVVRRGEGLERGRRALEERADANVDADRDRAACAPRPRRPRRCRSRSGGGRLSTAK